jgi:hypothetical protein
MHMRARVTSSRVSLLQENLDYISKSLKLAVTVAPVESCPDAKVRDLCLYHNSMHKSTLFLISEPRRVRASQARLLLRVAHTLSSFPSCLPFLLRHHLRIIAWTKTHSRPSEPSAYGSLAFMYVYSQSVTHTCILFSELLACSCGGTHRKSRENRSRIPFRHATARIRACKSEVIQSKHIKIIASALQLSVPAALAPPDLCARACTIDALLGSLNALGDISASDIDVHALLRATSVCFCVMSLVYQSIDEF